MVKRPISPFLAIYKPQVGSIFSILERISGIVLLFTFIVYLLLFSLKNNFLSFYFFYQIFYFFVKLSFADTS
jgi:succinate dehydrogenase/fumarate reductase cytochrome b subunit